MEPSKSVFFQELSLTGWEYTHARSDATDQLFQKLFKDSNVDVDNFCLVAVGGYGRRELCPASDFDVLLVHTPKIDASAVAESLWYPIWDMGLKIGYSVVTIPQLAELIKDDLHWATSVLNARYVAGSQNLFNLAQQTGADYWQNNSEALLNKLYEAKIERQKNHGDVAFLIEPELKNGRGGLRDYHTLSWASQCLPGFADDYLEILKPDFATILKARVELHRSAGRLTDILTFDAQDEISVALKFEAASWFMVELATAARRIGWYSDDAWARWRYKNSKTEPNDVQIDLGEDSNVFLIDRSVLKIRPEVDVTEPPCLILRMARIAAEHSLTMSRTSLSLLAENSINLSDPWNDEARSDFVDLLLAGRPAIRVIEDLDQFELFEFIFPEWKAVRCHPQRNVLHRFTVDRHLCETAIKAGELSVSVERPDLLVVGALLHDIGKGYVGDHTEVGVELISNIGERMGFDDDDIAILVDLCRHHLLLADVATRRDLSDPATAAAVASAVANVEFLHLLAALTEADSISTGPSAWGSWKKGLLAELVDRTEFVLEGGELDRSDLTEFPPPDIQEFMDVGSATVSGKKDVFTVVQVNVPDLFGLMAGVLAVSGLQVVRALTASQKTSNGVGFSESAQFRVQTPSWGEINWEEVERLAASALEGRLAIQARVAMKESEMRKRRKRLAAEPPRHEVRIDNVGSNAATIIEVHSLTTIGLLYHVTSALDELRLEIRYAKVQTFGPQMVNTFYVIDRNGKKIFDSNLLSELKLAVKQVLLSNTSE